MTRCSRRHAISALACLGAAMTCKSEAPAQTGQHPNWSTLSFGPEPAFPEGQLAELFAPSGVHEASLVVALHGRGEAGRGLSRGARGWRDYYDLEIVHDHLRRAPLTSAALHGMAKPDHLASINKSLSATPYRGCHVVCPYSPALSDRSPAGSVPFGRFVTGRLIPDSQKSVGDPLKRGQTGIDGVSMGGRQALWIGFANPDVFGSVGALQPAITTDEAKMIARLAKQASEKHPQRLRLASSEGDPFLLAVKALSKALEQEHLDHELIITPGPHDYIWNRGPGSMELLYFHDRSAAKA